MPWNGEFNTYIKERYTYLPQCKYLTVNVALNEEMHVYFMATLLRLLISLPGCIGYLCLFQEEGCEIMTLKCSFSVNCPVNEDLTVLILNLPVSVQFNFRWNPNSPLLCWVFCAEIKICLHIERIPELPLICHLQIIFNKTTNRLSIGIPVTVSHTVRIRIMNIQGFGVFLLCGNNNQPFKRIGGI